MAGWTLSVAFGDEWNPVADLMVRAGARAELRRFGAAQTEVVAPRVSVTYDRVSTEAFVAYEYVPGLDDGLPGDWLDQPLGDHQLSAGLAVAPGVDTPIMLGAAVHARPGAGSSRTGAETWLTYARGATGITGRATSEGVGTIVARHALLDCVADDVIATASLRTTRDRTDGGTGIVWRHHASGAPLGFELAAEAHAGTDGPGVRTVLGITW